MMHRRTRRQSLPALAIVVLVMFVLAPATWAGGDDDPGGPAPSPGSGESTSTSDATAPSTTGEPVVDATWIDAVLIWFGAVLGGVIPLPA